jgi:hypothetical protein
MIHIFIQQSIAGVNAAVADTPEFRPIIIGVAALATGSDPKDVSIDSIKDANRRHLLESTGVLIVYTVTAYNTDPATMQANIVAAVQSGSFTNALQSSGYAGATASAVPRIVDLSPTSSPTRIPTQYPTSSDSKRRNVISFRTVAIVGSVVGSLAGIALLLLILCQVRKHKKKSRVAIYEQESDGDMDDDDLECQAHMTHRVISADTSGKADNVLKVQEWVDPTEEDGAYLDSIKYSPARLKIDFNFGKSPERKKITHRIVFGPDHVV